MLFIKGPLKFRPYSHKKTLSRGTVCKLHNGELVVIDDNDWDNSASMKELNYYCFKVETNTGIDLSQGYNGPRYRMINQDEIWGYSSKKVEIS